jgi:uncharacterized protein (TIGR03435 family)
MRRVVQTQILRKTAFGLAFAAILMATANVLPGQEKPVTEVDRPANSTAPPERDYRFEVASIRPAEPPTGYEYRAGQQGYSPGRYRELNVSLAALAGAAFGIKYEYSIEEPSWMGSAYFTVNATLPDGALKTDLPIMIRHLLEDRFAMKYHHKTRQMEGYELIVAPSGSKLTKSDTKPRESPLGETVTDASIAKFKGSMQMKDGVPHFDDSVGSLQLYGPFGGLWRGRSKTMKNLASDLANQFSVPVLDRTGLDGSYDYDLFYTRDPSSELGPMSGVAVSGTPNPSGGIPNAVLPQDAPPQHPYLRDALREQLGLELRPAKNIPVDVVVIDSAMRTPTEN